MINYGRKHMKTARGNAPRGVDNAVSDKLMTLAGELALVRNRYRLRFPDHADIKAKGISQRLEQVAGELREAVLRLRLRPVSDLLAKLPAFVSVISKRLGRSLALQVTGGDLEVDKATLDAIAGPIKRLVEDLCKRCGSGSRISIDVKREGEMVRIEISTAAVEGPEPKSLKGSVERLGGVFESASTKGEGVKTIMRIPLSLNLIPCIVVTSKGDRFALPTSAFEEIAILDGAVGYDGDQEFCHLRGTPLPLVRLNEALAWPAPFTSADKAALCESRRRARAGEGALTFAVVKSGDTRFGLVVDDVHDVERLSVLPLPEELKGAGLYSGATVLRNGRFSLILDPEGVAAYTGLELPAPAPQRAMSANDIFSHDKPQPAMVFTNGVDEQFAIPLALVKMVERFPWSRVETSNGSEFLSIGGVRTRILRLDKLLATQPCVLNDEMYLLVPPQISSPFGILAASLVDIMDFPPDIEPDALPSSGSFGTACMKGRRTVCLDVYGMLEKAGSECPEESFAKGPVEDKRRILLVEDGVFFRQLVKTYLESDGYEVETASNGRNALDKLSKGTFDLVVSGIEMPVMNGWEFVKAIRADKRLSGLPVIALTSAGDKTDVSAGFDKYQMKIDRESLLRTVAESLRGEAQSTGRRQ